MRGVDVGIDVGTRGIGRDLGSCSAHLQHDPAGQHEGSRAAGQQGQQTSAGSVADPPDWNSGSWVMHAPLDD